MQSPDTRSATAPQADPALSPYIELDGTEGRWQRIWTQEPPRQPEKRPFDFNAQRLREIGRLILDRYQGALPNDEAGRRFVEAAASQNANPHWYAKWVPWLTAPPPPRRWLTPDAMGERLGLTMAERTRLKITTIRPVDCDKAQRDRLSKDKHNAARRAARPGRSQEQRRALIRAELSQRPEWSDRRIAAALGVDDKTVNAVRQRLEVAGAIPWMARTIGADGKSRPAVRRQGLGIGRLASPGIPGCTDRKTGPALGANQLRKFGDSIRKEAAIEEESLVLPMLQNKALGRSTFQQEALPAFEESGTDGAGGSPPQHETFPAGISAKNRPPAEQPNDRPPEEIAAARGLIQGLSREEYSAVRWLKYGDDFFTPRPSEEVLSRLLHQMPAERWLEAFAAARPTPEERQLIRVQYEAERKREEAEQRVRHAVFEREQAERERITKPWREHERAERERLWREMVARRKPGSDRLTLLANRREHNAYLEALCEREKTAWQRWRLWEQALRANA